MLVAVAVVLVAVLLVMAWRAPTHGPGRHPRADPRRRPRQSVRPLLPGRPRRRGRLRRPPLLAHASTWPTPASPSGASSWCSRSVRRAPPVVSDADGDGAGLARRRAGRQGGGPGGRRVAVGGRRAGGRRPGRVDGAAVRSRSTALRAGQELGSTGPERGRPRGARWPTPSVAFDVVYEDDDVIVVDKPAGLVVHPGAGHRTRHAGQRAAWPATRSCRRCRRRWGPTPTGRASSTGSTGAPRA